MGDWVKYPKDSGYYLGIVPPALYRDLMKPVLAEELAAWEIDDAIDEWCWLQEEYGE